MVYTISDNSEGSHSVFIISKWIRIPLTIELTFMTDVEIVGSDDVGEMATAVNRRHVEDTAAGDTTVPDVYEDVSSDIALTTTEKDMKDEGDGSHHDKTSGVSLPPCDGLEQRDSSEVVIISEGQEVSGWENEEEFKVVGKKECKSSSGDETQVQRRRSVKFESRWSCFI